VNRTVAITLFLLFVGQLSLAQVRRNTTEASQNQQAMAANQAQLDRDLKELEVFKTKFSQFEAAYSNKEFSKVGVLKSDLLSLMQREIEQSENKVAQDKREVTQSQKEAASSTRETNRSRVDRATPDRDLGDGRDVRDDRRDRRGDQADTRDDKMDLEKQIARTKRQKEIHATLKAFTFSAEPSAQEKALANVALLKEFMSTMEADITATRAEINEDKRESMEDSRERREDRRELRERKRNRRRY